MTFPTFAVLMALFVGALTFAAGGGAQSNTSPQFSVRPVTSAGRPNFEVRVHRQRLATPPSLKTRKMQVWTPKDALQFLEYASQDRLQAAWYLGLFAGLRRAEILGLRWQDLETADLTVNRGMVVVKPCGEKCYYEFNPPKTASSIRTISLSIDTVAVLKHHLE